MGSDDRDKPRGLATTRFGGNPILGETPFWDQFIGVATCCTELGHLTLIPTPQNGLEVAVPDGNHTV